MQDDGVTHKAGSSGGAIPEDEEDSSDRKKLKRSRKRKHTRNAR